MIVPANSNDRERLAQDAVRLFARMRGGGSRADRQALKAWLDQDGAHREAYLKVIDLWDATGRMSANPEVLSMREAALRRYPAAPRRLLSASRIAFAGLASVSVVVLALVLLRYSSETPTQTFQTGVGQSARIALVDGSQLTLDTDTIIRTRIGQRRREIFLDRGRAFFKVAKDRSRPFIVMAQGKSVTATGTAFEVTAEPKRFEVLLIEGHVRVSQPSDRRGGARSNAVSTDLDPGTRLVGSEGGDWTLAKVSSLGDLAWMQGQMLFDNERLGDIVADMNRYSRRKIILADPAVASRSIYGAFTVGDADQFVRALADYNIVKIESETENTVVLTAP